MNFKALHSKIKHLRNLAKWIPQAQTLDTLDSPFLFDFTRHVIWRTSDNYKLDEIEKRRNQFLTNDSQLEVADLGNGTFETSSNVRSVAHIAKTATSNREKCFLLYNLIQHFDCQSILELGTNLGISSLYMAAASPRAKIVTLEGDLSIMGLAADHAYEWANNIEYVNGRFEQSLDYMLSQERTFDMIFVDGGHHSEIQNILISYYRGLSTESTIWVIDDIYWSDDMTNWWADIKQDAHWKIAIDLYHFGILIPDSKTKEKIDVKILPKKIRWKPGVVRH